MKLSVCNYESNYNDEVSFANRVIDVSVDEFEEIVKTQRHYPRTFEKNHVLIENCNGSSGHLLDFDDGTTIEQFENSNIAKAFNYVLYTSRTHNKEKRKIKKDGTIVIHPACDRFHVILLFSSFEKLKDTTTHQKAASCLVEVCKMQGLNPDIQCKNINRKINPSFYPNQPLNEFFQYKKGFNPSKAYITDLDIIDIYELQTQNETKEYKELDTKIIAGGSDYQKAVDFLSQKYFDKRSQWLSVGFSLYSKFGDEGLPLWLKFAENPNYNDNEKSLEYTYKSFAKSTKREGSDLFIFAVANAIAKRDNDSIRFLTRNIEDKEDEKYNTNITLNMDGSNYLDYFNSFCAFDGIDGSVWIDFAKVGWKPVRERAAFSLFADLKVAEKTTDKKGNEKITVTPAFKKWIEDKKRIITELVFTNKPTTKQQINLFRGFKYEPVEGDITPFLNYLNDVICDNDKTKLDFILYFLASTFKFQKIPYYLILKGQQGAGKSFLAEQIIAPILGNHAQVATTIDDIVTDFNFHMMDKLFCYLEEAYFGGDTKTNDTLKSKVSSTKQPINIKFGAKFQAVTYTNYMVTTNHDMPTKVERDDRRTVIFDVTNKYLDNVEYYGTLKKWLDNGGYCYILDFLLKQDITTRRFNFDNTKEKKEAKENSMDSVERFWADTLTARLSFTQYDWFEGKKQAHTTYLEGLQETAVVYDVYTQYCKRTNTKVETQIIFSRKTKKIFNFERKLVGVNRTTGFELNLKEMITKFNEYFKVEMIDYSEIIPSETAKIISFPKPEPESIKQENKQENKKQATMGFSSNVVKTEIKQDVKEEIKPKKYRYEEVKDIKEPPF